MIVGLRTFGYKVNSPDWRRSLALACHVQGVKRVINRLLLIHSKSKNQTIQEHLNWLYTMAESDMQAWIVVKPPLFTDNQLLKAMKYHSSLYIAYAKSMLVDIYVNTDYKWLSAALSDKPREHYEFVQKLHQAMTSYRFIPDKYRYRTQYDLLRNGYKFMEDGEFGLGYYTYNNPPTQAQTHPNAEEPRVEVTCDKTDTKTPTTLTSLEMRDLQLYEDVMKTSYEFLKAIEKITLTQGVCAKILAGTDERINAVRYRLKENSLFIHEQEQIAKENELVSQQTLSTVREALKKLVEMNGGIEMLQKDKVTQELLTKLV
jgi:hypothetical protein